MEQYMSYYNRCKKKAKIDERKILLRSHSGLDFAGNLYYLAKEILTGKYGKRIVYVTLKNRKEIPKNVHLLMNEYGKNSIRLVVIGSKQYYRVIATAGYLFTDTTFSIPYQKREGQVVVQMWHGTPLKQIGFSYTQDVAFTGSQRKAFAMADYCLFPNEYTMKHMMDSYRLNNNLSGNILLHGYTRNSIFYDVESAQKIRKEKGLEGKTVFVYMPTWRGGLGTRGSVTEQLTLLKKLDSRLKEDQILYVKLHRLVQEQVEFDGFSNIRAFPEEMETYQFLSAADVLITDYSSVMFDFLCTRKKIILYTYDKDSYLSVQGTYCDMDSLPFPQVATFEELCQEMSRGKEYDDSEAYQKFCPYDSLEALAQMCNHVFMGKKECKEIEPERNQKENVLIVGGQLRSTCDTQNLIYYLDSLDTEEKNYHVAYRNIDFFRDPLRLQAITKEFDLNSMDYFQRGLLDSGSKERRKLEKFREGKKMSTKEMELLRQLMKRNMSRQFCNKEFQQVICWTDISEDVLEMLVFSDIKDKTIYLYEEEEYEGAHKRLIDYAISTGCTIKRMPKDVIQF